ncbi:MAG: 4-hydroxyphenylpyruvate dioxygenase family protein, partial [Candidatus Dormibacteria bacterium]
MTQTEIPATEVGPRYEPPVDHMPIEAVDHIEFWVGNARQAAYFYEHALGFEVIAYCGPETGVRDRASYVLSQGEVRLVLTTAMHPDSPIAQFAHRHGDGVNRIALRVPDVAVAFEEAVKRGATPVHAPIFEEDQDGRAGMGSIRMYGEVLMSFIERKDYSGTFLPGFEALPRNSGGKHRGVGIAAIDHIVGNVALGDMNVWVKWFQDVLGFEQLQHFTDEAITTEYSALMSKVMQNGSGKVKFPINEPAQGKKKS